MAWLDTTISTLALLFYSLQWTLYKALTVLVYTLRLIAWPITVLGRLLLFGLAPVIHTVRFIFSPLFIILSNSPRLEPLYIYFGSAAFIGILFSLVLALIATTIFHLFGLYENSTTAQTGKPQQQQQPSHPSSHEEDDDTATAAAAALTATTTPGDHPLLTPNTTTQELDALLAGISSSPESDHLLITALQGWPDRPNTKRKRQALGGGLRSRFGTILEEDDDSL